MNVNKIMLCIYIVSKLNFFRWNNIFPYNLPMMWPNTNNNNARDDLVASERERSNKFDQVRPKQIYL
jgi:hypothetical protein